MFESSNFYKDFFELNSIPNIYNVFGYFDKKIERKFSSVNYKFKNPKIYSFKFFPSYLDYKLLIPKNFRIQKVKQKLGFAIYIKDNNTIDEYLKECSTQHRKNVIRAINRLESCFDITSKMYFGDIPADHYHFIMGKLKQMIINRFNQRNGRNKTIDNWEYYANSTLDLIKKKKASLFVIYNKETPIEISINYHQESIMYSSISSYDLDYGKFSLGNVDIYKQLEWCMSNNIHFFDMGYGDFDYKRKWTNHIYDFEDHVIFHKLNFFGVCYAVFKKYTYKIIDYLISKNINDKFYQLIKQKKESDSTIYNFEYNLIPTTKLIDNVNGMLINLNLDEYQFLRKPVYDYLYKNQKNQNDIYVYQTNDKSNLYILKDNDSLLEIKFQ